MTKQRTYRKRKLHIAMTLLLAVCLCISGIASMLPKSYAAAVIAVYSVGEDVTATLYSNGCLSLGGSGETYDYDPGSQPSPFYGNRQLITSVEIGGGITSIGDYLFYNCGNLTGTLTIPASVVHIGTRAFSGDSSANAPSFKYVYNKFIEGDIVIEHAADTAPEPGADAPEEPSVPENSAASIQPVARTIVGEGEGDADGGTAAEVPAAEAPAAPSPASEVAAPQTAAPEASAPQTSAPQASVSEAPAPQTTAPETKAPETTPQTKAPETSSQTKAPETTSQTKAPETTSQTKAPETTSQTKEPETTSQTKAPETSSQTKAPETTSQTKAPETTSQTKVPETSSQTKAPETTSQTKAPETTSQTKATDTSQESRPDDSHASESAPSDTHVTESETDESNPSESDSADTDTESETEDTESTEETETEPETELRHITEQELGGEPFYPGQTGVYHADGPQNNSFCNAAVSAGYQWIDGWTQVTFDNGAGQTNSISVPVTSRGIFLPDFPATGLPVMEDAYSTYEFKGWTVNAESAKSIAPWNFTGMPAASVTAVWQKTLRNMAEQTITANVPGTDGQPELNVAITGKLPENASVAAAFVPIPTAQAIVDAQLGEDNGSTVLYALDIAILVDGEKYQPSDYGESVQVVITDLSLDEDQPVQVWHVAEDETGNAAQLEDIALEDTAADAVTFRADSFSTYIVAITGTQSTYNVKIAASDRYKLYSDSDCTTELGANVEVAADGNFEFWLQAEPCDEAGTAYYEITAYMADPSADGEATELSPVPETNAAETSETALEGNTGETSAAGADASDGTEDVTGTTDPTGISDTAPNGRYHYSLPVTTDLSIWFTSKVPAEATPGDGGTSRAELDLQDSDIVISSNNGALQITYAGKTWSYDGSAIFVTSNGQPTNHTITLESGIAYIYTNNLDILSSGNAINVKSGTMYLYAAGSLAPTTGSVSTGNGNQNADSGSTGDGTQSADSGSAGDGTQSADSGSTGDGTQSADSGSAGDGTQSADNGNVTGNGTSAAGPVYLTASGAPAIGVSPGAQLILSVEHGQTMEIAGGANHPAIGGGQNSDGSLWAGNIQLTNNGGTLSLTAGSGAPAQIVAGSYTYSTSANTGALPYTVALTNGKLVGYSSTYSTGTARLYAVDAVQSIASMAAFQSCGISYDLVGLTASETVSAEGNLDIILSANESELPMKVTVLRGDHAEPLVENTDFTWKPAEGKLTVLAAAAHGNLTIKENGAATFRVGIRPADVFAAPGRILSRVSGGASSTSVPANGAATILYPLTYAPVAENPLQLEFSPALPAGTEVTFMDFTDGGVYYYHAGANVQNIPLTDFIRMGTNDAHFAEPTGDAGVDISKSYQVCIDFPDSAGDTSEMTVTLSQAGIAANVTATGAASDGSAADTGESSGTPDISSNRTGSVAGLAATISRTGASGNTGSITLSDITSSGSTITVPVTVTANGSGNAALVMYLTDGEGNTAAFPETARCSGNGASDIAPFINGNAAIFNLGAASINGTYTVKIPNLSAGTYKVKAYVCVAPADEVNYPMHGKVAESAQSAEITVTGPEVYGITAELSGDSSSRIVTAGTGTNLTFTVKYTAPETSAAAVNVSVTNKSVGAYAALSSPGWTISRSSGTSADGAAKTEQVTVNIPAATQAGTYRINFALTYTDPETGKETTVTHPYNIIVE